MNNKVVIFEKDNDVVELMKSFIQEDNNLIFDKSFEDYEKGIEYSIKSEPLIVIFSAISDTNLMYSTISKLAHKNITVILLSTNSKTNFVVKGLRAGAKYFLSKPLVKKDVMTALQKCNCNEIKSLNKSNIISIYSNKGGIGKTAIATNLAVEFAKQTRDKVVLVDLNLPLGDVTTFTGVKSSVSLSAALENAKHTGSEAIFNACRQYKDSSLYILAEPIYLEETQNLTPTQIFNLFEYLREHFDYILIDLGSGVDKMNLKALELSDLILLVSIVNLPLIRNSQRCLDLFNNLGFDSKKTKIIINRYIENDEIKIEDVEKVLNQKSYWKIPNNYFTVMSSINKSCSVSEINQNSNVTLSFSGLTTKLIEDLISKDVIG